MCGFVSRSLPVRVRAPRVIWTRTTLATLQFCKMLLTLSRFADVVIDKVKEMDVVDILLNMGTCADVGAGAEASTSQV